MEHSQEAAARTHDGTHALANTNLPSLRAMFEKNEASTNPIQKTWSEENSVVTVETSTSTSIGSSPSNSFSIDSEEGVDLLSTDQDTTPEKGSPKPAKAKHQHSVRFREDLNQRYDASEEHGDKEDVKERWYSAEDYVEFRCFAAYIAGSVIDTAAKGAMDNMANSFIGLMLKSYWTCCSNDTVDSPDAMAMPLFSTEEMVLVKQIYEDTGGAVLVGLERHIAREIAADIRERRSELVCMAEAIQESDCPHDELEIEIQQSCQELSRASKLFARHMALVLAEI